MTDSRRAARVDVGWVYAVVRGDAEHDRVTATASGSSGRAQTTLVDYFNDVADEFERQVVARDGGPASGRGAALLPPADAARMLIDLTTTGLGNPLVDLIGPFWSTPRVAQALGDISRQAVHARRRHGSLLGLRTDDGDIVYPVAQFVRRDGRVEVKPGVRAMLKVLREVDPWVVAVALHTPSDELDGLTPLDWEREERDQGAMQGLARRLAAQMA